MLEFALFLIFPAAMVFAGAIDLFTMKIPNQVSLVLIAAFIVAFPFAAFSWAGLASHVGAGLLMLAVGISLFSLGFLGGGDAKILAVASLWLGLEQLPEYLVLVSVWGGLLVLAILIYRSIMPPMWLCRQDWAMRLHKRAGGIPYGIALAAGGLSIYPNTAWFTTLAL